MIFSDIEKILKTKTVGIAGCGGIGSNCAVSLARVGVGALVIADFDKVVPANLHSQFFFRQQIGLPKVQALKENLKLINPDIKIYPFELELCQNDMVEVFSQCDVIVEALDKASVKYMMLESIQNDLPGKPLVMGSGMAGWGNSNALKVICDKTLTVCGDGESAVSENLPLLAPRVGIVANMQANAVLEILLHS